MIDRFTTLPTIAALLLVQTAHAQDVRPYPDPGYRHLGVYGGGPDSYFDYHLVKLSLGDSFPNKRRYWADLKASLEQHADSDRHNIYVIYCGERGDSLEIVKSRLDAWLKPEPDIATYPEMIPAICLGEENVGSRNAVLDGLARYIRQTYRIPVFQWYTDPSPPDPELTADGWIWDSYGWDDARFRKHLMKFVALGKPAICVPWATDPHWPQSTHYPTAAALINDQWHQFRTCMEFDVSCAVFAVAGPGAMNPWLGSQTKDMIKLRNWLRTKRAEMHAFREGDLPLPSADFSARDRTVPVGGDADCPSVYEEDFSGDFAWIHDADIRGFLNLKLTSRPDEPGFLVLKPKPKQPVRSSLVYRFESYFPLESVEVTLDAAAPAEARCRNEIALSTDELRESWPLKAEQEAKDATEALVLRDDGKLKGGRVFYLRVSMQNHADRGDLPSNRLDRLRVECVHRPPLAGAAARLLVDEYGNLSYEDDFSTTRWRHLGEVKVAHKDHGGYRGNGFWVGMVGGYATSTHLLQRVSSPRELDGLVVIADCDADGKNLGGRVVLQVGPRGKEPKWEASTQDLHRGPLRLEVPAGPLQGLRDFDVHIQLQSTSGVEGGPKACATLHRLVIDAK